MTDKELAIQLRSEGKTYKEIMNQVPRSLSTISYYCSPLTKETTLKRQQLSRKGKITKEVNPGKFPRFLLAKISSFKNGTNRRIVTTKGSFTNKQFYEKFGRYTKCYLTGKDIDLYKQGVYEFDHIIPFSKGGTCNLDNLGILCKDVNYAKGNLTIEEFITLCKEVLQYNTKT